MDFGYDKVKFFSSSNQTRENIQVIAVAAFMVAIVVCLIATSEEKPDPPKDVPNRPKAQQAKFY